MSPIHESGYSKSVANFKRAITICEGYGVIYNPSREVLKVASLTHQYDLGLGLLTKVKDSKTAFDNLTNTRVIEFEDLSGFSTKLLNSFASHDVPAQAIDDAKGHNR